MAGIIWEIFGYRSQDHSEEALQAAESKICPFINDTCEKTLSDKEVSGVCTIKPVTSDPVICCPIRLYANDYRILRDVCDKAFSQELELVNGRKALQHVAITEAPCVAVFGKRWGGELRLPQKSGTGGYYVDWVLALLDSCGELVEFVAVEVQTIDTTGNYRDGIESLKENREIIKTSAGFNWENVNKRILPQLIYKGQVLQREEMCKKGLFFVCPDPIFHKIMGRLGGQDGLVKYALQPASITFLSYDFDWSDGLVEGESVKIRKTGDHSTTVYKVQEAFNNVTLPEENVYRNAILRALGSEG